MDMENEFDPAKNAQNIAKHGMDFADFDGFDSAPVVVVDDRFDYGETRFRAFGNINGKACCLVYAETDNGIRLISLRRAHAKEMRRYE